MHANYKSDKMATLPILSSLTLFVFLALGRTVAALPTMSPPTADTHRETNPPALSLHNHPRYLQRKDDGEPESAVPWPIWIPLAAFALVMGGAVILFLKIGWESIRDRRKANNP